jgi:hypothetical protein
MPNEPDRYNQSGALTRPSHDIQPTRQAARVERGIRREGEWGIVQSARAQAIAFVEEARIEATELVVTRAMLGLDRLHRVEAALSREDPIHAARYDSLVEDYLFVARNEIRNMPREF